MIQLGEHFKTDDRSRHSDWLRQQRWFIKSRHEQVRRDDIADKQEQSMLSLAADAIMATEIQIEKFKVKLDAYDEATIKALMENRQALDLVSTQLEEMLERAYVMEDGRRVFRTEDGTQVFDEFGQEVSRGELNPDLIRADQPTWERLCNNSLKQNASKLLSFKKKWMPPAHELMRVIYQKPILMNWMQNSLVLCRPQSKRTYLVLIPLTMHLL